MKYLFELLAACKTAFPDDAARIAAEEESIQELLSLKEYADHPTTKKLVEMCRKQIVEARVKLATVRVMDGDVRTGLWIIIASREWVLNMLAKDFDRELAQIAADLERELAR